MMRKLALLTISLSLLACDDFQWMPKRPAFTQYGVHADVQSPGFYGINSATGEKIFRKFDDPEMKGAQCQPLDDYEKQQAWVDAVKKAALDHCK